MDTASLRQQLERLVHTHSSVFAASILESGLSCARCGWCCRENFYIRITKEISRPSNAISVFPEDVKRIIKGTGKSWDEIVKPDIYSCLDDGKDIRVIGWILRRSDKDECIFYTKGGCGIYEWRPMICRCYPFFMGERDVEVMHCEVQVNRIDEESAKKMALIVKRYEMKKLRSYIGIISQLGGKLRRSDLCQLPCGYEGEVIVFDGDAVSTVKFENNRNIYDKQNRG
ncbi:MAG: YkgJ family cysteine cluster protein [Euryarchaeota archaeon]|nr:YkgJ family cysteine cluster protein [Euryarchaeota archaeon]MBU4340799.1 YkgJ family cysteine cluster protein [Euryarchaeota archaeon]MCG2734940.1 YkgJ family cysteine cluster protein [Candidatus Methanoperedenaceae archaeon]